MMTQIFLVAAWPVCDLCDLLRNLNGEQGQLGGHGGGWKQGIAERGSLPLELGESGFLKSELVKDRVRFLVRLLVFKQVVDEASQFACCSGGCLRRSEMGLLTPVEDAQAGLRTPCRLSSHS